MKKLNKILILLLAIFMLFSNVGLNMVYAEDDNEKEPPIEEVIPPIDEEPDTPTAEEILNVEKAITKQALSDYTASIKDVEASELTKVKNTALSNIDKAKSVDEVNQALEAGKTALKNIDKIKPPEVDKPKPPKDDAKDEEVVETPLSSNNYLSSLTLSEGSLNFSRQVLSYRVVVDNNVSSLRVSATADDKGATVSGTGIKYLDVYANEIIITVKAENGSERVYTINVIRLDEDGNEEEVDSSNELLSLTISGCDLDFDADILDYKCEVDNLVDKVEIDALAVDEDAVVEISNIDKLIVGDNLIKIKVTAINGDIKTYTVTVNRSNTVGIIMIEDLSKALETLEADEITVIANSSEIVSKALMQKIKDSKKIVYINKLDSSDELLYSWRIDGSKITYVDTLYTKISLDRNKNSNLDTHIKDYKGLVLAFNDNPSLPLNTKVGINVNNQF